MSVPVASTPPHVISAERAAIARRGPRRATAIAIAGLLCWAGAIGFGRLLAYSFFRVQE